MNVLTMKELETIQEVCPDTLIHGDCLEAMKYIADGSIDMICADLPYGTTACKWDSVIPFAPLWEAYRRIIKPGGAIVLFGAEPFASVQRLSNIEMYRYDWIWDKGSGTGHLDTSFRPLRCHETVSVFYGSKPTYNPQKLKGVPNHSRTAKSEKGGSEIYGGKYHQPASDVSGMKHPRSVVSFPKSPCQERLHPTQKPVPLFEYLIKTYTNPGDLVLDNTMGSGTTPVACLNTRRHFIGIELDAGYFAASSDRVRNRKMELALTLDFGL